MWIMQSGTVHVHPFTLKEGTHDDVRSWLDGWTTDAQFIFNDDETIEIIYDIPEGGEEFIHTDAGTPVAEIPGTRNDTEESKWHFLAQYEPKAYVEDMLMDFNENFQIVSSDFKITWEGTEYLDEDETRPLSGEAYLAANPRATRWELLFATNY